MDISKLEVGKFYMEISNSGVKYILLLNKPKLVQDAYTVKAFIIMVHKSIDNVYIYSLDKEDHKLWLRDTSVIFSMEKEDFEYVIGKIFETESLEWSD